VVAPLFFPPFPTATNQTEHRFNHLKSLHRFNLSKLSMSDEFQFKEYRGDGAAYADDADGWEYVDAPRVPHAVSSAEPPNISPNGALISSPPLDNVGEHVPQTETLSLLDNAATSADVYEEDFAAGDEGWLVVDVNGDGRASVATDCAFSTATPATEHDEGEEEDDEEAEEEEAEVEEEEDAGGEVRGMSRECSNADDDWVLETILKRRRAKQPVRRVDDDDGGREYLDVHEYLCKWKWYDEPTWESRQAIEELGHVERLDAFDADHRSDHQGKKPSEVSFVKDTALSFAKKGSRFPLGSLEGFIGTSVILNAIIQASISARFRVERVAPVSQSAIVEFQFLWLWRENFGGLAPRVVYSRIPLHQLSTCDQLNRVLPMTIHDAKVRNYMTWTSRNCEKERFLAYIILAPNGATRHQDATASLATYHAISALVKDYVPHASFSSIAPWLLAVPMWLVEGRALSSAESSAAPRETPTRLSVDQLMGGSEDETAQNESPPTGRGVVKMRSADGEVYYKQKRAKKPTKPVGSLRNQQSTLRLQKMSRD
jgi:hypothetical protein